jgi:glycosyltransferase involved in cell wall biosynthesis
MHALRVRDARLAFVSADLLGIARAAAPRLARWLDRAAIVQPMGVSLGRLAALARRAVDPPELAVVARLVPIKGVDVAIGALARVRAPARLTIAGEGPLRALLERLAGPRVTFIGAVDELERDNLLARASALLVPSRVVAGGRTEGMPLVALEALAAGVPVVASAVGGLPSIAPVARLVPPDDPRALAEAIDRVLAAPPAAGALRASVAHHAWSEVAARLTGHALARRVRRGE